MRHIQDLIITRQDQDIYDGMIFCGGSVNNYSGRANSDVLYDFLKSKLNDEEGIHVLCKGDALLEIYSGSPLKNNIPKIIQCLYEVYETAWHHLNMYSKIEGEFKFTSINIDNFKYYDDQYIRRYYNK